MKPFNLEEYLANPNKKVVTRDGRTVERILCTDAVGNYPIVALVKTYDGTSDRAIMYTKEGMYINGQTNGYDLFFASERHEGWINVYLGSEDNILSGGCIYNSKEEAEKVGNECSGYITTSKIEWEDRDESYRRYM